MADAGATKTGKVESRGMSRVYRVGMIVIAILALLIFSVGYTTWVDSKRAGAEREADRRWCQLLSTLDQAYSAVPPSTELGRKVAAAIHDLKTELDC